jgi:hypothetical protein
MRLVLERGVLGRFSGLWHRSTWMGLGALNAMCGVLVLLVLDRVSIVTVDIVVLRHASQIQFMHGMATLSCATFMNIGARRASFSQGARCTVCRLMHRAFSTCPPLRRFQPSAASSWLSDGWC